MSKTLTQGLHHLGLTVSRLEESARFFTEILGWSEVRRDPTYPAIFVSDGSIMVTLWRANDPDTAAGFNRKDHIGLHHLALRMETKEGLDELHKVLSEVHNVSVEFAPELLRGGPAEHMMCYEPSGIRVEFIWPGP